MRTNEDRHPSELAWAVARWFARGGSHMNYYMYHGGNNYGSTGGASLAIKYADGVNFHSDGLPNEPKKTHMHRLHLAIAQVSADLVAHSAQQFSPTPLLARNSSSDPWRNSSFTHAFTYGATVFLENANAHAVDVQWSGTVFPMNGTSVLILQGGKLLYDTADVVPATVQRSNAPLSKTASWQVWKEAVPPPSAVVPGAAYPRPVEQLNLTRDLTDYLYYERNFTVTSSTPPSALTLHAATGNAFLLFIDAQYVGACDDHSHPSTTETVTCSIRVPALAVGPHALSLLSVSLGIENGMPSNQVPYSSHWKGLSSSMPVMLGSLDLTAGAWTLRAGLEGERRRLWTATGRGEVGWQPVGASNVGVPLTWYDGVVSLPAFPTGSSWALLLDLTGLTRGHCWVNGRDIAHYNLVEGGTSGHPTQWLYHVPQDWLVVGDNHITIVEELGGDPRGITLLVSTMQPIQREEPLAVDRAQQSVHSE